MFRLPRLPDGLPLVTRLGNATQQFQRWWQTVVERIENAINRADAAQAAADAAGNKTEEATARIALALEMLATQPNGEGLARIADALEGLLLAPVTAPVVTEYMLSAPVVQELNGLADLTVREPTDRQVLLYDGATAYKWVNAFLKFNDLDDVVIATPANGHVPIYNATTSKFVNATLTAGTGITITNAAGSVTIASSITNLDSLSDVAISGPSDGQTLIYSGTGFVNASISAGSNITVTGGAGSISIGLAATISLTAVTAAITDTSNGLIASSTTLADGAGAAVGTLNNAPVAGDPTKWVPINDNGTARYIPTWG